MEKVGAIVVTYNRLSCLRNVLSALDKQTFPISHVLVFDNSSNDGTHQYLLNNGYKDFEKNIIQKHLFFRSKENLGGAGGFSKAVSLIQKLDIDKIWIMDDDVLPEEKTLELLIKGMIDNNVKVAIPRRVGKNFEDQIAIDFAMGNFLKAEKVLLKERPKKDYYFVKDMTFEGPLIDVKLSKKVGLPDPSYFIFYDDTDYAFRLQKYSKIVYVSNAKLGRQIPKPSSSGIVSPYTWRDYYMIRNTVLFEKKYGYNWKVRQIAPYILVLRRIKHSYEEKNLRKNLRIIFKGWYDGMKGKRGKTIDPNY